MTDMPRTPMKIKLQMTWRVVSRLGLVGALAALAMFVAACGSDGNDDKPTATTPTTGQQKAGTAAVNASLGEYFIRLDTPLAPAGKVKFHVTNDGSLKHEFVIVKTDLAPDKLPVKGNRADEEAAPSPGEIEDLGPGKAKNLAVSLKPGKYVLICNLPRHYQYGQRTGFTVQ